MKNDLHDALDKFALEHPPGSFWERGCIREADGTVREETDNEFRDRIKRGDRKTPRADK